MPEQPEYDHVAQKIVQTYILATRERRYVNGQPIPLAVSDITNVIEAHPVGVPRSVIDYAIFAIDDLALSELKDSKADKQDSPS